MSIFQKKYQPSPEETAQKEAYLNYKKLAKKGDVAAQFSLGECYYNGTGVERDWNAAMKWFSKAATAGYPQAQYALGECWEKGRGTDRNRETAIHWYTLSAKQGFLDAQTHLAHMYLERNNHQEASRWYCAAAEQADPFSISQVGYYYLFGKGGVQTNYGEAVKCFQKLIDLGKELGDSCHYLGICYEYGYGVEKDPEKAYSHLSDAVFKHGNYSAMYELGKCYETGFGVAQDIEFAIKLYERQYADCRSQYALGQIYYNGNGVEKDIDKAVSYFERAAVKEHPAACYMLGYLYYSGIGVARDYDRALVYLGIAKEYGNKEALALISKCESERDRATKQQRTYRSYDDQTSRALDEQMRMNDRNERMRELNDITTFSNDPNEIASARSELYDMGFYP